MMHGEPATHRTVRLPKATYSWVFVLERWPTRCQDYNHGFEALTRLLDCVTILLDDQGGRQCLRSFASDPRHLGTG